MIKAIRPIGEKNGEKSKKTKASDIKKQKIAFKNALWKNKGGQVDNGEELHICNHRGPCSQTNEDCYCSQNNLICSPYCHCGPECRLRFPGCDCKPGQCRSDKCNCFFSNRECDPNICKSCNSGPYMFMKLEKTPKDKKCDEVSILTKKRKNKQLKCCKNVNLQRGNFKRLLVGESNIAGYGCFLDDTAEQGDFIAEYTGEIISTKEGERRGLIYDQLRCSYIFNLNQEESVDANRFGNHIRFVNHNDDPNCFCQIMVVNGEHRIGFFAKRRIHKGEELFFDYNYDKNAKKQYVPKS